MRHIIAAAENAKTAQEIAKSIQVIDCLFWIKDAWNQIKNETIMNCFRKAGFNVNCSEGDESNSDVTIVEEMKLVDSTISQQCYLEMEDDVNCTESLNKESLVDDIAKNLTHPNEEIKVEDDEDVEDNIETRNITAEEAQQMLKDLQNFSSTHCPNLLLQLN